MLLILGARELVEHLHDHGIPMAIATSASYANFDVKRQAHMEFFSLFHHVVTASDEAVKRGKPAPDMFLTCAERFSDNPPPHKVGLTPLYICS